jgi:pimeloyl-ACP methyl ester carboxylesterase
VLKHGGMEKIGASGQSNPTRILVLADGRHIGCAEYGDPDGLPVLALHGTPGSRLMFALTDSAARDKGVRLIAPERPGYGLSDVKQAASLAQAATDVAEVADAYGFDRFALIGVSGGGPYAIAAAAANLDRVVLLALAGPVGPVADLGRQLRLSRWHRLVFNRLARSRFGAAGFFRGLRYLVFERPELAYRLLLRRVRLSDREILVRPEVRASLRAAMREGLRRGVEGAVQDLRLYCAPWQLQLAEIDVPAIVWQGSDDAVVPPAAAYALARKLPNCRLDVIPAGHYWVFDQFDMILDAVAAALRADAEPETASPTPAEPAT